MSLERTASTSLERVPSPRGDGFLRLFDSCLLWDVRWSTIVRWVGRSHLLGDGYGHEPEDSPDVVLRDFVVDLPPDAFCRAPDADPPQVSAAVVLGPAVLALKIGFENARGYFTQVGLPDKPRSMHALFAKVLGEAGIAAVVKAQAPGPTRCEVGREAPVDQEPWRVVSERGQAVRHVLHVDPPVLVTSAYELGAVGTRGCLAQQGARGAAQEQHR